MPQLPFLLIAQSEVLFFNFLTQFEDAFNKRLGTWWAARDIDIDSSTAVMVTAGPLALDSTSREYVGRVTAVINPVGRLAALLSVALAGSLVSTVLHGFHASVLGISFGPVDTLFSGMG